MGNLPWNLDFQKTVNSNCTESGVELRLRAGPSLQGQFSLEHPKDLRLAREFASSWQVALNSDVFHAGLQLKYCLVGGSRDRDVYFYRWKTCGSGDTCTGHCTTGQSLQLGLQRAFLN